MSLTSTYETPSGAVEVSINTSTTEVMQISSMGDIKYEFDIGLGQATLDRLFAIYNTVDIEIFGQSDSGTDLFDYLIAQTVITKTVDLAITGNNGAVYRFRFTLGQDSIKYNTSTKMITLLCNPIQPTQSAQDAFDASPSNERFPMSLDQGDTIDHTASGIGALNFIKNTLTFLNPLLSTVYSSYPIDNPFSELSPNAYMFLDDASPPVNELKYAVVRNDALGLDGVAIETVKRMAAIEGSIVGTGFDKNFYIQRLSTEYLATIGEADLEELSFEYGYKPYSSISVTVLSGINSNLGSWTNIQAFNNQSLKQMDIRFSVPYLGTALYFTTGYPATPCLIDRLPAFPSLSSLEVGIIKNGTDSYAVAFGAQNRLVVEVEVLGVDKIKPYDMVVFTAGDEIPTAVTGKYFRPTSLSYNFLTDKAKAKMYYVADV